MHKTSELGLDMIKRFEGFRSEPYICPGNKLTIGYGHVILADESYDSLTKEEAHELLRKDVEQFEGYVRRYVTVKLNPNQFDALVSFTYNVGPGALKKSTLLLHLNEGNYDEASKHFESYVYASGKKWTGLVRRRKDEKTLFLKPYNFYYQLYKRFLNWLKSEIKNTS